MWPILQTKFRTILELITVGAESEGLWHNNVQGVLEYPATIFTAKITLKLLINSATKILPWRVIMIQKKTYKL